MTREQLQELKSAAAFVADSNRGMFQNTGMEGFQPEPGSMFAERLLRLLLERERLLDFARAVEGSLEGDRLFRADRVVAIMEAALAFVEEEA